MNAAANTTAKRIYTAKIHIVIMNETNPALFQVFWTKKNSSGLE